MNETQLYNYWAKKNDGASRHPLLHHCLDVGAVAHVWLQCNAPFVHVLSTKTCCSPVWLQKTLTWFAIIHDCGKLGIGFQRKCPEAMGQALRALSSRATSHTDHEAIGLGLWEQSIHAQPTPLPFPDTTAALDRLAVIAHAAIAHHGKPKEHDGRNMLRMEQKIGHPIEVSLQALLQCATSVCQLSDATDGFSSNADLEQWRQVSWLIAGVTVLADWIASNSAFFPFVDEILPCETYFHTCALPRARQALQQCDALPHPSPPHIELSKLFPAIRQPRPLQHYADQLQVHQPGLYICEDLTGSGKTEAALTIAARLMAAGQANGFYVALPTMATANAMYDRLGVAIDQLFPDATTSFSLNHGRTQLRPSSDDGGATCAAWLNESSKRRLLAQCGVGTIDQALLAVLACKHNTLRLLGLQRKVLIIDEIHAYDDYVGILLEKLLRIHASFGGSAILLSATLPLRQRQQFIDAWYGEQGRYVIANAADYPLITHCRSSGAVELPSPAHADGTRTINIKRISDQGRLHRDIIERARSGQCICWIRNTVTDAQQSWQTLRELGLDDECCHIFHARFCQHDRNRIEAAQLKRFGPDSDNTQRSGHVLVATQVVEQSLDLDFDLVISDLAPIDLLIQRAGRCQRHKRTANGQRHSGDDYRQNPQIILFAPQHDSAADETWLGDLFSGSAAVYGPSLLWHTSRALSDATRITMPDEARSLIEAVYDPGTDVPSGLARSEQNSASQAATDRGIAFNNHITFDVGYRLTGNKFLPDVQATTRLGDPATTLRLAVWDGQDLRPFANAHEHAWALSECRIPRKVCQETITPDAVCAATIDRLRQLQRLEQRHDLCFAVLTATDDPHAWTIAGITANGEPITLTYSTETGLSWNR